MNKLNKFIIATVLLWLFCFPACTTIQAPSFEDIESSNSGRCLESAIEKTMLTLGGSKSTRELCSKTELPKK